MIRTFFLPHTRPGLKGHPYKVEAVAGGEVCEGRQILRPGVRSYGPHCLYFQEKVGASVERRLSPSSLAIPLLTKYLSPKLPTINTQINLIGQYLLAPCIVYGVSSHPLWPKFIHYKSKYQIYGHILATSTASSLRVDFCLQC